MTEHFLSTRQDRLKKAVGFALGRVVPPALSGSNPVEIARGVLTIAPAGQDSEIARALMSDLEGGMSKIAPEQAKWFAMGAVSQALATDKLRQEEAEIDDGTVPELTASFFGEVLVKVTPLGEAMWNAHYAAVRQSLGDPNAYPLLRDEAGRTQMYLHDVATIFGSEMWVGRNKDDWPIEADFQFVTPPREN